MKKILSVFLIFQFLVLAVSAQNAKPRARDLGVPFDGVPGQFNAITDVKGVEVGYTTLISGEGKKSVRTGVTAILPQGKTFKGRVFAGWHTLNGNGEMTGTTWIEESGGLGSPVMITNTHSVGVVRDAVIEWGLLRKVTDGYSGDFSLPVVAETYDGFLNDINGFHVKKEHVFEALDSAKTGAIAEGNVGGGTGMSAHFFKGGTGTASRVVKDKNDTFTVGVLVQANYGSRQNLNIAGIPVGREIKGFQSVINRPDEGQGSIIIIVATDAPLLPHQLKRLAHRAGLGVGIMGGRGENPSGDIFLAFSTANASEASKDEGLSKLEMLPNDRLSRLFNAVVQATEEAIVNAMIAGETMKGVNGNTIYALPQDQLREILKKYNRLQEVKK